jgi:hypothetical protein
MEIGNEHYYVSSHLTVLDFVYLEQQHAPYRTYSLSSPALTYFVWPCVQIADSVLLETHEPDFKWKIHGFSAHLLKGAISSYSSWFDCCGYKWYVYHND